MSQRLSKRSRLFTSIRRAMQESPRDISGASDRGYRTDVYYSDDPYWRGTFFIRSTRPGHPAHYYFLRDAILMNTPGGVTPEHAVSWNQGVTWRTDPLSSDGLKLNGIRNTVEITEIEMKRWPPKIPEYQERKLARRVSINERRVEYGRFANTFSKAAGRGDFSLRLDRGYRILINFYAPTPYEIGVVDDQTPSSVSWGTGRDIVNVYGAAVESVSNDFRNVYDVPVSIKLTHPRSGMIGMVTVAFSERVDPDSALLGAKRLGRLCARVQAFATRAVLKAFPALTYEDADPA